MQEHLIIDGNNALFAILIWPEKWKLTGKRGNLLLFLEPLGKLGDDLLTVVFDGKGGPQKILKHKGMDHYSIICSSSVDGADGVIENVNECKASRRCGRDQ